MSYEQGKWHQKVCIGEREESLIVAHTTDRRRFQFSRLVGARLSTGPALVFLDSHSECGPGWLEPLLSEVSSHPSAVVAPHLDVVDHDTMEYVAMGKVAIGNFGWDARFRVRTEEACAAKSILFHFNCLATRHYGTSGRSLTSRRDRPPPSPPQS